MDSHNSLLRLPRVQLEKLQSALHSSPLFRSSANTALTAASTAAAVLALWLYNDYRAWTALGTGGTPPTPAGYWRMTKIRIGRLFSRDDLRDAHVLSLSGPSFLHRSLPDRRARRPRIQSRTMPQRQHAVPLTPAAARTRLYAIPEKFRALRPDVLELAPSRVEGGTTEGLYAKPNLPGRHVSARDRVVDREIAHVHPAENSLHVWLSEPDARKVVEAGWGERFPLTFVHPGFTFVYAPETLADVEVIEGIVEAGIGYLTGVRF